MLHWKSALLALLVSLAGWALMIWSIWMATSVNLLGN